MRRRQDAAGPPSGLDLDDALRWLIGHGAPIEEVNAYLDEHGEDVPDPRPGAT